VVGACQTHGASLYGGRQQFSIEKSCGIGIYIPFVDDVLYGRYSLLDWYKDSGLFCMQ
jgi:hypothetical protein